MRIATIVGVARPPFLVLTPVCVLLGFATAMAAGSHVDWQSVAIALAGALSAQVSVNALNEYSDFRSGLDFKTTRTPFSGGSGTLVAHPDLASQARLVGLWSLGLTILLGILLISRSGWGLLPLGIVGLVLVFTYTDQINRNRYLCLIAPGLGFGPLMVLGVHYVATGGYSLLAVLASLVPFFLVNNLLLLNQFPDVAADRSIGRDNFPVAVGKAASLRIYGVFAFSACVNVLLGVLLGGFPVAVLLALLPLIGALHVYRGVGRLLERGEASGKALTPFMAINVAVTLVTPALVAAGLLIAG